MPRRSLDSSATANLARFFNKSKKEKDAANGDILTNNSTRDCSNHTGVSNSRKISILPLTESLGELEDVSMEDINRLESIESSLPLQRTLTKQDIGIGLISENESNSCNCDENSSTRSKRHRTKRNFTKKPMFNRSTTFGNKHSNSFNARKLGDGRSSSVDDFRRQHSQSNSSSPELHRLSSFSSIMGISQV